MDKWIIITFGLLYLSLLFGIAYYAEKKKRAGKSVINNAWTYSLSLAVYCSAWTYYGSVGRASTYGLDFLAIYIGPTIGAFLFVPVLGKILKISKTLSLVSLADFISTRYGKSIGLASLIAIFMLVGIIPYISIQLEAITKSIEIFSQNTIPNYLYPGSNIKLSAFLITIILIIFIILFGTRSIESNEKHEGLVAAVTFESIVKIIAFLIVGIFVTFFLFDGFGDLFTQAAKNTNTQHVLSLNKSSDYFSWWSLIVLSLLAFYLLPRQFQVSIVENNNETHLKTASWLFPLYMLTINIFVLPIAIAGLLLKTGDNSIKDYFLLSLPVEYGYSTLAMITFIGGFSAATSMIIVETIALSTMMSNNLVMPWLLSLRNFSTSDTVKIAKNVQTIRRLSIVFIVICAFLFDTFVTQYFSLVSIGLISFVAVAQFAPAVFGGIYWKEASHRGVVSGIIVGFSIWAFTAILPSMIDAGIFNKSIIEEGLFGIDFLKPNGLFGMKGLDMITHCFFWSMSGNIFTFFLVSILSNRSDSEIIQAEIFVNINKLSNVIENKVISDKTVMFHDLTNLINQFLGEERGLKILKGYANRHKIDINQISADPRIVAFSEKVLGTIIGTASSHIMINNISGIEKIEIKEIFGILNESKQIIELNKELTKKSNELKKAKDQLMVINEQLQAMDIAKDEFLYTVTHELRTPLTSIRAMSEILYDNPDLDDTQKQMFLGNIVKEVERLSHLITQVLNLERYESGRQKLQKQVVNINDIIVESMSLSSILAKERQLKLISKLPDSMALVNCDKDLIQQVVYNLLSNAIKFAHTEVILSLTVHDNEIEVSVEDDGPGIEESMKEKIFEKFFQANNQIIKKPKGTGLGLAICKKIMDLHGGEISVQNGAINNTKFVFNLPF